MENWSFLNSKNVKSFLDNFTNFKGDYYTLSIVGA